MANCTATLVSAAAAQWGALLIAPHFTLAPALCFLIDPLPLLFTLPCSSPFSAGIYKSFTVSSQRISKFKESADAANTVQIYLAVVRLRSVQTDLLISFNVPLAFGHGSSSEGRQIMGSAENLAVIEGVLATLKVREWGLFGGA